MIEATQSMKKDELLAIAQEKGIFADPSLTKAQLVDLINGDEVDLVPQPKSQKPARDSKGMAGLKKFDKFRK